MREMGRAPLFLLFPLFILFQAPPFDRIMREPFSVDTHVQYFHMEQRDYVKDLFVAVSDRFGDIRFRGRVLNVGITTTFRF